MCFNFQQPAMQSRAGGRLLTVMRLIFQPAVAIHDRDGWLSLSFSTLLSGLICPPASLAMLMQWVAAPAVRAPGVILTPISGPGPRPPLTPQHCPDAKKGQDPVSRADQGRLGAESYTRVHGEHL